MRYAAIRESKIDDIIECTGLQMQPLEKALNCLLVECQQYPVQIGDTYENGSFYHKGEVIERIPTDSEKISILEIENKELKSRLKVAEEATLGLMNLIGGI